MPKFILNCGNEESKDRFIQARQNNKAIVPKVYKELVETGFQQMGKNQLEQFNLSTDTHNLPYMDLDFVEL